VRKGLLAALTMSLLLGVAGASAAAAPPDFAWGCHTGRLSCVVSATFLLSPGYVGEHDSLIIDVAHPDGTPAHYDSVVVSGPGVPNEIVNTSFYGVAFVPLPPFTSPGTYTYQLDAQGYTATATVSVSGS